MGAEFTWVYANTYGSRKGKDKLAEAAPIVPARCPEGDRGVLSPDAAR